MTSSMLSGDRRWTSGRKAGMTVLGKVAVPKPINLPSQRLENHGLDPSVEIVPKGTLSWGSKSSSTNAWGSSTLSPNTDGGGGSPSHHSGRPSSGGSGTRPSTAGSDRSHEPNAWSSNSRPSSASGAQEINQTSATTLRPRSAETRPGSAQLSRFAEALSESSLARSAAGINDKPGEESSKNDGFALTSRDFPTLGLEKENSGKDHGADDRPRSSSGLAPAKEGTGTSIPVDVSVNVNVNAGTSNSIRRNLPHNVEKWQPDLQSYPNHSFPPQHYDAWRGPPMNNHPACVWYRGPPGGPPFSSPVPPGGFPMEPVPYYRPQIPATALANPHLVPPPGAGPRGPHPNNGDMYRPHMADAYMRPGMPIRPGFYHGPMPCEGYYGPPVGYSNSNEREILFMGMPPGPSPYNRYTGPNAPDASNSRAKPSGHGPFSKPLLPEQVESGNPHETRGPYKVLLKHHDNWDGKDKGKNWEDSVKSNDWRANHRKEEEIDLRRAHGEEDPPQDFDRREGGLSVPHQSIKNTENLKASDEVKKHEHASSEGHGAPAAPQDSSLIQKIESLNAKARAVDGQHDILFISVREEQKNKSQVVDGKGNHSANGAANSSGYHEQIHGSKITDPAFYNVGVSTKDKFLESTVTGGPVISRTPTHGVHAKVDQRNRAMFNAQDVDGKRKKFPAADSSGAVPTLHSESSSDVHVQDQKVREVIEMSVPDPRGKDERGNGPLLYDPSDTNAQRTKMAELAKQRAIQRQKEEEERTRDQRAKALAKLEELNRRTQGIEVVTQKSETVPSGQNKQLESRTVVEPTAARKLGASSSVLASNSIEKSTVPLGEKNLTSIDKKPAAAQNLSVPLQQEVDGAETAPHNNAPQAHDHSSSKQKRATYKQKQNNLDKPTSTAIAVAVKSHTDLVGNLAASSQATGEVGSSSESSLPGNTCVIHESSLPQRKKNNRSSKYKHRVDETSSASILPPVASHETNHVNATGEIRTRTSESASDPSFVKPTTGSSDANQSSGQVSSSASEEGIDRVNNHPKSLHSRRTSRNPQANRMAEKFHGGDAVIWAPVRAHNRSEVTEEAGPKNVVEGGTTSTMSTGDQVQNTPRNKRAEMERYVPKPIAKEMAQQGVSLHSVAPSPTSTSDETVGRAGLEFKGTNSSAQGGSSFGKVGAVVHSNKQGKGSWRQRGSESINQDVPPSQTSRNVQMSGDHSHPQKPEASTVKVQPTSEEWNASENWNASNSTAPALVREQGGTGKGKRHASKGHKGMGESQDFDPKKSTGEDSDKVSTQDYVPETSPLSIPISSKENRGVGERSTSHWQPKSQAFSGTNQKGSRTSNSQGTSAEMGKSHENVSAPLSGGPLPSQQDRGTRELNSPTISAKSFAEVTSHLGLQEAKREQKITSTKRISHPTSQGPRGLVEQPHQDLDAQLEHRSPSGHRRNGNQNSHFGRGQGYSGDWTSAGQDNKQHNTHRDRPRHNPHYGYQPVGSQNNSRANNFEGSKYGAHNSGSRFIERSQSHSRRGGGRQSGTVWADGFLNGERETQHNADWS